MGETINKILINVDISDAKPDGRPLYEYKISEEIFLNIKNLLTEQWNDNTYTYALFVIYAAELIRKEHTDGHLNWNNLFNPIRKNEFNNHNQRTNIVLEGLRYWGRVVFVSEIGSDRYLETLRLESGFPLNEGGNIAQLVKSTYQQIENFAQNETDLIPFIIFDAERFNIPNVLKQDSFYRLVSNICFKFFEWKQKYELGKQKNPVEHLSNQRVNWKDEMPMKIDGDKMISFFNNLISEISKIEKEVKNIIKVESRLIKTKEEIFDIKTYLTIPKGIYTHQEFGIDETVFNELNGDISIYFQCEGKSYYITKMSITVDRKISSLGLNNFSLPESLVGHKWSLYFTSSNSGLREEINLKNIFDIDNEEPKVFVEENDEWIFKGNAPIKIKESKCRVVFENPYNLEDENGLPFTGEFIGKTINKNLVYEVSQDCTLRNIKTSSDYVIKVNQQADNSNVIYFVDERFPARDTYNYLNENKNVYVGFPNVLIYNKILGVNRLFNDTIEYFDGNKWAKYDKASSLWGKIKFRFKDRLGDIIGYKTLTILPEDLAVTIKLQQGIISIHSNQDFQILQLRGEENFQHKREYGQTEIMVDSTGEYALRSLIHLKLVHPNYDKLDFKVPNPNLAEVFVNGDNKVSNQVEFSLSKIHGFALQFNNYSGRSIKKSFEIFLEDEHNRNLGDLKITKSIDLPANSSKRLTFYQYTSIFSLLFSLTQNTRAKVRIRLVNQPQKYIQIKNYDFELIYNRNDNKLYVDDPSYSGKLELNAFRLDKNFIPDNLHTFSLENNSDIMHYLPENGRWFVYSSSDFKFKIGPKVIVKGINEMNGNPEVPLNELSEGSGLNFEPRIRRFKEFFDGRYLDFSHDVWRELYDLYQATKHLPMNALDVWKGLVKSPKGMLTFLLSSYADTELIKRITDEMGFIWHFISLYRWKETYGEWLISIPNMPFNENHRDLLKQNKLQLIESLELFCLKEYLIGNLINLPNIILQDLINVDINGSDGNLGLRSRHPEGLWANYASDFINKKFWELPNTLKDMIPHIHQEFQKSVVFLPVIMAYHSVNGNHIMVRELTPEILLGFKLNMEFDKTYFDDVYAKVQGFCINQFYDN
jgi:hypothetical protein